MSVEYLYYSINRQEQQLLVCKENGGRIGKDIQGRMSLVAIDEALALCLKEIIAFWGENVYKNSFF